MKSSTESPRRFRVHRTTLGFLAGAVILAVIALWVGIEDNLPGALLLFSSGLAMVLAGTHRWKDPRKFGLLFLGCVVGFFIMVVVHNFSEVGAGRISHIPALALVLSTVSVISFMLAVIVCPMGGMVGAIGGILTASIRGMRKD